MAVVASASEGLHAVQKATIVQLRSQGMTARELEANAIELVAASAVPVLISSRCDIVLASGAAGVNLPERDIAVHDARTLIGQRLIGRSVHSVQGAMEAEQDGADFVIFGPVWPSESHAGTPPQGLEALGAVARAVGIPVLAIGGVTEDRIAECHAAGAAGYAAIRLFQ
jgi:thiamine-phosphate diphosphorylase